MLREKTTIKLCVLLHVCVCVFVFTPFRWDLCRSCPPPPPSHNHDAMNIDPQQNPTKTEFWMTRKTPILWLFSLHSGSKLMLGTKTERQERKEMRRGESKREASAIWRKERYMRKCDGYLQWVHKQLWQKIIFWRSKVFESTKRIFHAWEEWHLHRIWTNQ